MSSQLSCSDTHQISMRYSKCDQCFDNGYKERCQMPKYPRLPRSVYGTNKYTGGAPPPTPWKWRRVPPSNTGECPHPLKCIIKLWWTKQTLLWKNPDNKVHGANMGPTWVLSAPDGPHVGPMNLAIRDWQIKQVITWTKADLPSRSFGIHCRVMFT